MLTALQAREVCYIRMNVPEFMDGSLLPAGGNSSSVAGTLTLCGADKTRKTNLYYTQAAINGLSGEGNRNVLCS